MPLFLRTGVGEEMMEKRLFDLGENTGTVGGEQFDAMLSVVKSLPTGVTATIPVLAAIRAAPAKVAWERMQDALGQDKHSSPGVEPLDVMGRLYFSVRRSLGPLRAEILSSLSGQKVSLDPATKQEMAVQKAIEAIHRAYPDKNKLRRADHPDIRKEAKLKNEICGLALHRLEDLGEWDNRKRGRGRHTL